MKNLGDADIIMIETGMKIRIKLQPIADLNGDGFLFYEMLASGLKSVGEFFSGLEETGEIKPFNLGQIAYGLDILKIFQGKISVNVSLQTLCDPVFSDRIINLLESHLAPIKERLVIEVTEKHKPEYDMLLVAESIRGLHKQGCSIAIDDVNLLSDPRHELINMPEVAYLKLEGKAWHPRRLLISQDLPAAELEVSLNAEIKSWIAAQKSFGKIVILEGVRPGSGIALARAMGGHGGQMLESTLYPHLNFVFSPGS